MICDKFEVLEGELFHVHTFRCKHAEEVSDEAYIKRAIEMGAPRITFTDHAPFPGDPFRRRMDYAQLPEYIATLSELRTKYEGAIEVRFGLECEYLPSFKSYYEDLRGMDLYPLIIGQHFAEIAPGQYSFQLEDKKYKKQITGRVEMEAIAEGAATGIFACAAHPDRSFSYHKKFDETVERISREFVEAVVPTGIALEYNLGSFRESRLHKKEFWGLVPDSVNVVMGTDAHAVAELDRLSEHEYGEWRDSE